MTSEMQTALDSLPHGPSFRFLNELITLEPGSQATARYLLRGDEEFLAAHFPGNPMMPGVLLIEAIAQLGGIVVQPALTEIRLTGVRAAKILGAAVPGDVLEIRAKIEGQLGGLVQIEGDVHGPGGLLASAKVTLSGEIQGVTR
jgi:3-hydroxyacyl-[acyl-carrier-protein] dehydratase